MSRLKNRTLKAVNLFIFFLSLILSIGVIHAENVEKWKLFELKLQAETKGNPFIDTQLAALFIHASDTFHVKGFYDGDNTYKIRFMPNKEGRWKYKTISNVGKLNKKSGSFNCTCPQPGNYGPVNIADTVHFSYADGTPYYPFGTTCYAWVHQPRELIKQTLQSLSKGLFNKLRMCIFPKSYDWNKNEPDLYPFKRKSPTDWEYTQFNPDYFRNIEKQIATLDSLGIEADLIVFHPYDRWGFASMKRETDDLYIEYIIARFAAFKNIWWSIANEYDYMKTKSEEDWKHFLDKFSQEDPYNHLRSIHNAGKLFEPENASITHICIQNGYTRQGKELSYKYHKPVIFDECGYEGNVPWVWGNLTAKRLVDKFWISITSGSYTGHGESYITELPRKPANESDDILWWSKGGKLHGQSPTRIKFLRKIIEDSPHYLKPSSSLTSWMDYPVVSFKDEYYLVYFSLDQPCQQLLHLPKNKNYKIDVIDAWNMTITALKGTYKGSCWVELPGQPLIALRIQEIKIQ